MSYRHVEYDKIASTYNRRFDHSSPRGVADALLSLLRDRPVRQVLEVGCGTGYWLEAMQPVSGQCYGLDLSAGMLREARKRKGRLGLVHGCAESLPFLDASFDLVYCVNAIHHFARPRVFVREARRLLRPGGELAVLGSDPHCSGPEQWYAYHYFEGTWETDLARFPRWGDLLDWMVAVGCEQVSWSPVDEVRDDKVGRAVLKDVFLAKESTSQLAMLSGEAYAAGLRRIEMDLAEAEARGETLTFPTRILIGMLVGRVPAGS